MRHLREAGFLVLGLALIGCSDSAVPVPTDPRLVQYGRSAPTACDASLDRTIKTEQAGLFAKADLTNVQTLWSYVELGCDATSADADNGQLMAYVANVLSLYPAKILAQKKGGDGETNFLAHINSVFTYVGYSAPGLPTSNGPLDVVGALGVIPATGGTRELPAPGYAALTFPVQSGVGNDTRAHLFALYPSPGSCTTGNLAQLGPCYEVAAFPSLGTLSDNVTVGVCNHNTSGAGYAPALAHIITGGSAEIAGNLAYPLNCSDVPPPNTGSWSGGLKGVVTRLAWLGKQGFSVNTAYATHSGLGGVGGTLSPWGGVDLQVFNAPVDVGPNANVVGSFPVAPVTGTWDAASFATSPGSIKVQSSLGNYASPLIVMSQAGGACNNNCGGLLLQGDLASASGAQATTGKYEVSFVAVQASPSVKEAPFILRDNAGREIARVSFMTKSSVNQLVFDNGKLSEEKVCSGGWTRNASQVFTFTVKLTSPRAVDLAIGTASCVSGASFVNPDAAGLGQIAFEAQGIDSGVMGWDNIKVQRLSDR